MGTRKHKHKCKCKRKHQHKRGGGGVSATRKQSLKEGKITNPARIVIIDNDETTGSFWPLYKILHLFRDYQLENVHIYDIVKPLATFCVKTNIFRPGILKLLNVLYKLRTSGKLDAIVMYTYQDETMGRKDDMGNYYNSHGQQMYVPKIIDYCFGYLATNVVQPFFDIRITRPDHRAGLGLKETDRLGQKSIDLVFQKLQIFPSNDLRGLVFIDNCYINNQYPRKYKLGPLTATYIKDYKFTISDIQPLLNGLKKLYTNFLKQYISNEMFQTFMKQVSEHKLDNFGYYSDCTPKNILHTYDEIDLTALSNYIYKYYSAANF